MLATACPAHEGEGRASMEWRVGAAGQPGAARNGPPGVLLR
jgi:hypothetical protein